MTTGIVEWSDEEDMTDESVNRNAATHALVSDDMAHGDKMTGGEKIKAVSPQIP